MKINALLLSRAALAFLFAAAPARADFTPDFAAPPYEADHTALGVEGWEARLAGGADKQDAARIVAVRWNDYKPAMMLKNASLKNVSFPATTGQKVSIGFQLAVTSPDGGPSSHALRIGFAGLPCGEIFFDQGADGGLGYKGEGSGRGGFVCLPKTEMKLQSFYTFSLALDYANQTYSMTVTGEKKDGTPFEHKAENLPFQNPGKKAGIDSLYILSSSRITTYLSSLRIESH